MEKDQLNHLYSFVKLLLLITVLYQSNLFAQKFTCFACGSEIQGDRIKVAEKYFHPEHFVCAGCGKQIIAEFITEGSKYYHTDCYSEQKGLVCDYCKKRIVNEYIVSSNKKYHKECYEEVSPKCAICNSTLTGSFVIDYYSNKYHSFHEKEYSKCNSCDRLVSKSLTNGGQKYSDGRTVCNLCFPEAIFDQARINGLLDKVRIKLSSLGISIPGLKITASGVSLTELKRIADEIYSENVKGFCSTEIITKSGNKPSYTHKIYVLNGLPELIIESILAHELMHVWFVHNTKDKIPDSIVEGSCNYASYLYLNQFTGTTPNRLRYEIDNDKSALYGEGFRIIKSKFNGAPVNRFLEYLKKY